MQDSCNGILVDSYSFCKYSILCSAVEGHNMATEVALRMSRPRCGSQNVTLRLAGVHPASVKPCWSLFRRFVRAPVQGRIELNYNIGFMNSQDGRSPKKSFAWNVNGKLSFISVACATSFQYSAPEEYFEGNCHVSVFLKELPCTFLSLPSAYERTISFKFKF